jgi:hypothetical protein
MCFYIYLCDGETFPQKTKIFSELPIFANGSFFCQPFLRLQKYILAKKVPVTVEQWQRSMWNVFKTVCAQFH